MESSETQIATIHPFGPYGEPTHEWTKSCGLSLGDFSWCRLEGLEETLGVLKCECGDPLETVIVEAPATVVTIAIVQAELEPSDLHPDNIERVPYFDSKERMLKNFRFSEQIEVLDGHLAHADLEIDYKNNSGESAIFIYCPNCNGELTREVFDAWCERATGDTAK